MGTIIPLKLAGVYTKNVRKTPGGMFCVSDADWRRLCRSLSAAGVNPNRDWSYEVLMRMIDYADQKRSLIN